MNNKKYITILGLILSLSLSMAFGIVANADSTYTVKKGDSLWKIAGITLGNGNRYREIEAANKNTVKNGRIIPGMVLRIPDGKAAGTPSNNAETKITPVTPAPAPISTPASTVVGTKIKLDSQWKYADFSKINSGEAVLYKATVNRKDITIAVNAGHGTKGGSSVKTYCHPDKSPKTTGGSTGKGATMATAVAGGMTFADGTPESKVTLEMAVKFKEKLLSAGYDVLMIRDGEDVQLDNIARTVIANNIADCHIAIHWDGDGLKYDKGCFYISTPSGIKNMEPVKSNWEKHEALGKALISGLKDAGCKIHGKGNMDVDLTQTSYSTIPSVDIELGNAQSVHNDAALNTLADGMIAGVNEFFK